jgi:predicted PurR-regulated permease PerM
LANFVPYVGAIIATILPLPVVLLDPAQSGLDVLLAMVLPVALHTIVGNVVEPKVFGVQMELHPVVIMLSLSFWYAVWGVPGAILSVPITAVMRIILSNLSHPYAIVSACLCVCMCYVFCSGASALPAMATTVLSVMLFSIAFE